MRRSGAPDRRFGAASRRAARSSAWLLVEAVLRVAATAAVSFWIARRLGPLGYGVLNLASALAVVCGMLATLGLEVPVVVRLARGNAETRGTLADLLWLRALAAGAATLLGIALIHAAPRGDPESRRVALIALLAVIAAVPMLVDYGFKARVEAGVPARARTLAGVVGALARVAVVGADLGIEALASVLVGETLLASLLLWRGWRRFAGSVPHWRDADPRRARQLLRRGLPYLGIGAMTMMYTKADLLLVGQLADSRQAGLYAAAQKLSEVLYLAPAALADSVYPLLVGALQASPTATDSDHAQLLFDLVVASAIVVVLLAQVAAPLVIVPVFGPAYAPAVGLFQAHAWTAIAAAMELARTRWLGSNGNDALVWLGAVAGAAASLAANLWAVPRFGAAGGVGAALTAFAAMAWLPVLLAPRLNPLAAAQWRALWPWPRLWAAWRSSVR